MGILNFFANNIYSGFSLGAFLSLLINPINILFFLFYGVSLLFNSFIYPIAATSYTLFPLMAHANFSSLGEQFQLVVNRIEVFVGVFMLFVVAFNVLQYMIDPDKNSSATSKLIMKVVVSLVLLVSSSFIFSLFDDLQNALIGRGSDNLIEVILFGEDPETNLFIPSETKSPYESYSQVGRSIAYNIFFAMYANGYGNGKTERQHIVNGDKSFISILANFGSTLFNAANLELGEDNIFFNGTIVYHYPILAEVVGLFLIVVFVTFAIDIGVRNFTLLFLRILFPIAALGYLIPKKGEGILTKFVSSYVSTYLELFVKTFTIYLILYMILWVMNLLFGGSLTSVFDDIGTDGIVKVLLLILLIVALFLFFFKGFPKLMEEIFGIKMNNSLGGAIGKALGFAAAGAGLMAGGIAGAIKGGKGAGFGGAMRGMASGAKRMASAGYGAGKSLGAGKVGDAIRGISNGKNSASAGIAAQTSKAAANRADRRKKHLDKSVNSAEKKNNDYQMKQKLADKAKEEASKYDENDHSYEAEAAREKARIAQELADKAKEKAKTKDKKTLNAQEKVKETDPKYNPEYESKFDQKSKSEERAEKKAEREAKRAEKKAERREEKFEEKLDRKAGTAAKRNIADGDVVDADYEVINSSGANKGATVTTNPETITVDSPEATVKVNPADVKVDTSGATATVNPADIKVDTSGATIKVDPAGINVDTSGATATVNPTNVNVESPGTTTTVTPGATNVDVSGTTGTVTADSSGATATVNPGTVTVDSSGATVTGASTILGDATNTATLNPTSPEQVVIAGGGATGAESPDGYNSSSATVTRTEEGVKYVGTDGQEHILKTPSFISGGGSTSSTGQSRVITPTTVVNEVLGNEAPATSSERQEASSYSEKMNETKESVSTSFRNTIDSQISGIGGYDRTPSYTNDNGTYTVYTSGGTTGANGKPETFTVNTVNGIGGGIGGANTPKSDNPINQGASPSTLNGSENGAPTFRKPKFMDTRKDAAEVQRDVDALNSDAKDSRVADLRAHGAGTKTTAKIDELMKEGKNALEAEKEAYAEAEEFINKRVEELVKQGISYEEALNKAKLEWNEGIE